MPSLCVVCVCVRADGSGRVEASLRNGREEGGASDTQAGELSIVSRVIKGESSSTFRLEKSTGRLCSAPPQVA